MPDYGFPSGSVIKKSTECLQCRSRRRRGFDPGFERSPGGEMETLSSILAWRIPWTDEPGGLQPVRLQRAGHDLVMKQQQGLYPLSFSSVTDVC